MRTQEAACGQSSAAYTRRCSSAPPHREDRRSRCSRHFAQRRLARGGLALLLAGLPVGGECLEGGRPYPPPVQSGPKERGRDPFHGPDAGPDTLRPPGLAGVGVMEAVIRGIVRYEIPAGVTERIDTSGRVILESPSGEGFVAAPGDRLLDGIVGQLEDGGVTFWVGGDRDRPVYRALAAPGPGREEGR